MTRWRYRAADARGAPVEGEVDAPTVRDATDALRRRALWVTTIEPLGGDGARGRPAAEISNGRGGGRVPRWLARLTGASDRALLAVATRAMATLLDAGVPLDRALGYAAEAAGSDEWRTSFAALEARVREGSTLSAAVARDVRFPRSFAATIAAAESTGTLAGALTLLADQTERDEAIRARVLASLAYPAVLAVASTAGVIVMLLVVVPRFATLIADSGGTLPASTRALIALSAAITHGWWVALLTLAALAAGWRAWSQEPANRLRWHAARLGWPVIGTLERSRNGASYLGALSTGLRAGVPLLASMTLARDTVSNLALARALEEGERRVRDGARLAPSLEGTLPPLALRLMDAGESAGALAEMTERGAAAADAETTRAITAAVALIEPALIVVFGGIVGFVALALLQAIYGIGARG